MIIEVLSDDRVIVRHKDSVNFVLVSFSEPMREVIAQDSYDCQENDEYIGG